MWPGKMTLPKASVFGVSSLQASRCRNSLPFSKERGRERENNFRRWTPTRREGRNAGAINSLWRERFRTHSEPYFYVAPCRERRHRRVRCYGKFRSRRLPMENCPGNDARWPNRRQVLRGWFRCRDGAGWRRFAFGETMLYARAIALVKFTSIFSQKINASGWI